MRKALRWIGYGLAAIALVALIFAAWVWFASSRILGRVHETAPERLAPATAAQLADAGRQARIMGCAHCHGERLQGGLMFDGQPFATVWAPNLAELAPRVSDQQLARAVRRGIGHDGRALFIMPSDQYSRFSDQEVAALIAEIRRAPRSGGPVPPIKWGPIGRFALAAGQVLPTMTRLEDYRIRQPFDTGPGEAAGRRLAANGCSACHGPDLAGGAGRGGGAAPPDLAIAGAYDLAQFRTLMRTGVPPGGRDLGEMKEVAARNFSSFTDEEVAQLHAYLQARAERVSVAPAAPGR
jgi:mono/diheme cytochrome c family protein